MDCFERAHVPKKSSSKMESKPDDAVKRQLKQMMNAYKKGNNQDIRNSSNLNPKLDQDEIISISDFSEFSTTKDNSMEIDYSSSSDYFQSTSNEKTSKSESLDTDLHARDTSEDITEFSEEFKGLSTSIDNSASTSSENTSAVFGSAGSSDSSELSIPSSLRSSGSSTDVSEDEFDADGELASKILEKLGRKDTPTQKRKHYYENLVEPKLKRDVNKIKSKTVNIDESNRKKKKVKKVTHNKSTDFFIEEDLSSDIDSSKPAQNNENKVNKVTHNNSAEFFIEEDVSSDIDSTKPAQNNESKIKKVTHNISADFFIQEDLSSDIDSSKPAQNNENKQKNKKLKETDKENIHVRQEKEMNDESINNSIDITSNFSSPYLSVSADNMSSQSLDDLVGKYVHPTIRNLSTDKQTIPTRKTLGMFHTDEMIVNDVIDDEISSLVPEVDEELAVEDLNLDTDTQELIDESNAFNDTIPTENNSETNIEDMIADTTLINNSTVEEEVTEDTPMKLYSGKGKYVLVMKHKSELYIHGKLQIADINGQVEIFGYKLNYDSIQVYAPYCNFAQCLKVLENPHKINPDLYSELISVGLTATDANEIVSTIEEHNAVVILSKLESRPIDFVSNNFSTVDLFSSRSDNTPRFLKRAADNLGCSFYIKPPKRCLEKNPVWDNVYTNDRDGSRGIVCGGKGTGKSTFLRHYVNTLLAEGPVLVIDLDPGQAEFNMPGNISATTVESPLLGPNYTHLKTPERMLNIGIINTMDNAKRYLSAVSELIAYCRSNEEFRELPWIVNTMGLCNQLGLKFMIFIILQIQPTFLLQLDSRVSKKRFEVQLDPLTVAQLYEQNYANNKAFANIQNTSLMYSFLIARHEENSRNSFGSILQPRDERYLNILAYFGELLNDSRVQGLMEIVPYEVHMKDLNIGLNIKIPTDMVAKVINGKIIALCQQNTSDKGIVFTLGDKALLCHGHGLIRGIDFDQGLLYILTPVSISKLNLVDTLVYSDWMPELRGQEEALPGGTAIPYRTANTGQYHRKLMFPPRRRFNPLQLLRITRNT